jgi:1,2-diacylglycerol 3-alpha-glucosyltransferase
LVSDCYHPTPNGVTSMVALLARGLAARGHRVVLIAPAGPRHGAVTPTGVAAPDLAARSVPLRPAIRLRLALPAPGQLERTLRCAGVEVVHTHTEGPLGWCAGRAAARLGLPRVHTLHTLYGHYLHYAGPGRVAPGLAAGALDRALGRFLRGVDLVVAPSVRGRAEVARLAADAEVAVVPNGVAVALPADVVARTAQHRARLGLGEHDRLLLAVGRVAPEKRSEELLAALAPLLAARPNLRFVQVGGGPLLRPLRRRVAALGLADRLLLPGYLPHDDVLALARLAAVLVSASVSENDPVSLLEAAAAGVPLAVRADAGLGTLVVDGVTGVVAAGDRELAVRAADLAADPARCRRLGAAARRVAAARSDAAHLDAITAHYARLRRGARRSAEWAA